MRALTFVAFAAGLGLAGPAFADWTCEAGDIGAYDVQVYAQVIVGDDGRVRHTELRWEPKQTLKAGARPTVSLFFNLKDGALDKASLEAIQVYDSFAPSSPPRLFIALQTDRQGQPALTEWQRFGERLAAAAAAGTAGGRDAYVPQSFSVGRQDGAIGDLFKRIDVGGAGMLEVNLIGIDGKIHSTGEFDIAGGVAGLSTARKMLSDAQAMVGNFAQRCEHNPAAAGPSSRPLVF